MTIERIVRPFQTPLAFDAHYVPPEQPATTDEQEVPTLSWGGSADAKWTEEPSPTLLGLVTEWTEDASQRKTEKVRVENPNDSSQFVEVERIKTALFRKEQVGIDGSRTKIDEMRIKMDWSRTGAS